ncbi:MAG: hypothetical protein ACREDU_01040 [Methylocella sp.]
MRRRAWRDPFAMSEDRREPWRVAHPLPEVRLLVVSICDCAGDAGIAVWSKAQLPFPRRCLPDHHGVADAARRLTIHIRRSDPGRRTVPNASRLSFDFAQDEGQDEGKDLALQSRPRQGSGSAPPCCGLRHHAPPRARPGGHRRQDQPTHGNPGAPRPAGDRDKDHARITVNNDSGKTK